MKLAAYTVEGQYAVGVVSPDGGHLTPIPWTKSAWPVGIQPIIERWGSVRAELQSLQGELLALGSVTLTAPIPSPRRNVFCVGKNYLDHAQEFGRSGYDATGGNEAPSKPIFFTKATTSVIGPGGKVDPHEALTKEVDYEAELAVIIGRGGRGISRAEALDHVWGYTIINDITSRDLQRDHRQWFLGKSLDTFCPMGPWAVTADGVDHDSLDITCKVNGEVRQSARTSSLIFDIPTLIETLSAGITLLPGDIVATGTPEGVGVGFDPPKFLSRGDEVEVEITGLGVLRNRLG
jgi:2-keto-4-pentenoate hydratase/2-oxohepta-3-ene-1,7-dioic acid hydratase in catechol pathway